MKFEASDLARGWLSVAIASGTDDEIPALFHTICIEQHTDGVRLISTGSDMLLHCFVPAAGGGNEPLLEKEPLRTTVAIDRHGRARGLLAHARALDIEAQKNDGSEVTMTIDYLTAEAAGQFPCMATTWVVIDLPGVERLRLPTYDGSYPKWRIPLRPACTAGVALSPKILGRLAKLDKLHPGEPLIMQFAGDEEPVALCVESDPFSVHGWVAQVRRVAE